jgi:hypothetical protein
MHYVLQIPHTEYACQQLAILFLIQRVRDRISVTWSAIQTDSFRGIPQLLRTNYGRVTENGPRPIYSIRI